MNKKSLTEQLHARRLTLSRKMGAVAMTMPDGFNGEQERYATLSARRAEVDRTLRLLSVDEVPSGPPGSGGG